MASLSSAGVRIMAVSTCAPAHRVDNIAEGGALPAAELARIVNLAGVRVRHVSPPEICTSDLCLRAAERLLAELRWPRDSVSYLLFVSQTPDYLMPTTACCLHQKLGLSVQCAAFDVNLGCSGYPYGLAILSRLLQGQPNARGLLLVGETPSKICSPEDRATWPIFGDIGSATALETTPGAEPIWFSLHTDGEGYADFIVRAGGFRARFSPVRRDHFIEMNGPSIFAFTMKRVPPLIDELLSLSGWAREAVDYFVFHQANRFIIEHLRKKVAAPATKVPMVIGEFGNTGGGSVPLVLTCGGLVRSKDHPLNLFLLGYGVGLSWAGAAAQLWMDAPLLHSEL
jgi:3-oxoacyl-[acyl-carrier-protein] synthase III